MMMGEMGAKIILSETDDFVPNHGRIIVTDGIGLMKLVLVVLVTIQNFY